MFEYISAFDFTKRWIKRTENLKVDLNIELGRTVL